MTASALPKAEEAIGLLRAEVDLPDDLLTRFAEYRTLCSTWNLSAKLMSPTDLRERFDEHLADCLGLVPYVNSHLARHPESTLVDVGAGGGLPGLVIALAMRLLPVWEIERSETKCLFLRQAVARLGLDKARILQGNFPGIALPAGPIIYTARATEASATVDRAIAEKIRSHDLYLAQRDVTQLVGVMVRPLEDAFSAGGLRRGVLNSITK